MPGLRVAVAAEWPEVQQVVVKLLRDIGHSAAPLDSSARPDVVVSDTRSVGRLAIPVPVVLMSGGWTRADVAQAERGQVCLVKPFTRAQLAEAVMRAAQSG